MLDVSKFYQFRIPNIVLCTFCAEEEFQTRLGTERVNLIKIYFMLQIVNRDLTFLIKLDQLDTKI